jgi:hypothetical protein
LQKLDPGLIRKVSRSAAHQYQGMVGKGFIKKASLLPVDGLIIPVLFPTGVFTDQFNQTLDSWSLLTIRIIEINSTIEYQWLTLDHVFHFFLINAFIVIHGISPEIDMT